MDNLWLLTEERPKAAVLRQILALYCRDFDDCLTELGPLRVRPVIVGGVFQFLYVAEGLRVGRAAEIYIKTVSGGSSFLDFLLFRQADAPTAADCPLMAIEETKTSDQESRNTSVYQRGAKFVYIRPYYPGTRCYMLYHDAPSQAAPRTPSDTGVFGTRMLLTLGVRIAGRALGAWARPFADVGELIRAKAAMRRPPAGNVPITIVDDGDQIRISGRLSKPADAGNINHDPNIGALSLIGACLRQLGWAGRILLTCHGAVQDVVDRARTNKFLRICRLLDLELEGITLPPPAEAPPYWHYEAQSEKLASILLHLQTAYCGLSCVYENHARCERGYFRTRGGQLLTLPKRDRSGGTLYLPDVVLHDPAENVLFLIEGKQLHTLQAGVEDLRHYGAIEAEYLRPYYPGAAIQRWLTVFGGARRQLPHPQVLLYLADDGRILLSPSAPESIRACFPGMAP